MSDGEKNDGKPGGDLLTPHYSIPPMAPFTDDQPREEQAETPRPPRENPRQPAVSQPDAAVEFGGELVPVQFRVPSDLLRSLKLLAADEGRTMSEIAIEAMTHRGAVIDRVWVSRRGGKAA